MCAYIIHFQGKNRKEKNCRESPLTSYSYSSCICYEEQALTISISFPSLYRRVSQFFCSCIILLLIKRLHVFEMSQNKMQEMCTKQAYVCVCVCLWTCISLTRIQTFVWSHTLFDTFCCWMAWKFYSDNYCGVIVISSWF